MFVTVKINLRWKWAWIITKSCSAATRVICFVWIMRGEPFSPRDHLLQCHAAQFLFLAWLSSSVFSRLLEYLKASGSERERGCTFKVQHTNFCFPSAWQHCQAQCPFQVVWLLSQLHQEHGVNHHSPVVFCAASSPVSHRQSSLPFLLLSFT